MIDFFLSRIFHHVIKFMLVNDVNKKNLENDFMFQLFRDYKFILDQQIPL